MKVMEVIKRYGLEDCSIEYHNQYGNFVSSSQKENIMNANVKAISINFPTNQCTLTIIDEYK